MWQTILWCIVAFYGALILPLVAYALLAACRTAVQRCAGGKTSTSSNDNDTTNSTASIAHALRTPSARSSLSTPKRIQVQSSTASAADTPPSLDRCIRVTPSRSELFATDVPADVGPANKQAVFARTSSGDSDRGESDASAPTSRHHALHLHRPDHATNDETIRVKRSARTSSGDRDRGESDASAPTSRHAALRLHQSNPAINDETIRVHAVLRLHRSNPATNDAAIRVKRSADTSSGSDSDDSDDSELRALEAYFTCPGLQAELPLSRTAVELHTRLGAVSVHVLSSAPPTPDGRERASFEQSFAPRSPSGMVSATRPELVRTMRAATTARPTLQPIELGTR
jgi:hypothetical protein